MDPRTFGRGPSSSTSSSGSVSGHGTHRRAHSETFLRQPEDFLLLPPDVEDDFSSLADLDFPSLSDDSAPPPVSIAHTPTTTAAAPPSGEAFGGRKRGGAHLRSLSVDGALFERLGLESSEMERHVAVDDVDSSLSSLEFPKKAMAAEKLAELALVDPKRAKRILANRQSAARSKERKVRYTSELEKKVQTLQTEATTLSAQVTLLQKDTSDLTVENKELKLRLDAMEQQAHLRDALNEALREEVQRLKITTGQIPAAVNGDTLGLELQQQSSSPYFGQLQQQQQLRGPPSFPTTQLHASQLPFNGHTLHDVRSSFDAMDLM